MIKSNINTKIYSLIKIGQTNLNPYKIRENINITIEKISRNR